jgi:hypothetical protein
MKKFAIILSCFALCACQDSKEEFDGFDVIDNPFEELIGSQQGDFDKAELERQLFECAYVHETHYKKAGKGWTNEILYGAGVFYGFVVDDGVMTSYAGNPPFTSDVKNNSDFRYSAETATIYTVYKNDGKEYAAKVVYYKDGCVVFEGCLPSHYSNKEPETYLYIGYFSKEKKEEWENSDHWVDSTK